MFWISHLLQNFEATKLIKNTLIKKKKKKKNGNKGEWVSWPNNLFWA